MEGSTNQVIRGAKLYFSALALGICATSHLSELHTRPPSHSEASTHSEWIFCRAEEGDAAGYATYSNEGLAFVEMAAPRGILSVQELF